MIFSSIVEHKRVVVDEAPESVIFTGEEVKEVLAYLDEIRHVKRYQELTLDFKYSENNIASHFLDIGTALKAQPYISKLEIDLEGLEYTST